MKNFILLIFLSVFLSSNVSYANESEKNLEIMEDEEVDYDSYSNKSSSENTYETEEKEEYNMNINNYVNVNYTSTKNTKGKK